jgi:hypothetical protein
LNDNDKSLIRRNIIFANRSFAGYGTPIADRSLKDDFLVITCYNATWQNLQRQSQLPAGCLTGINVKFLLFAWFDINFAFFVNDHSKYVNILTMAGKNAAMTENTNLLAGLA